MTIVDMLGQSGILTLLGMGVVFSFLVIMIICMYALAKVLHLLKLDKEEVKPTSSSASAPQAPAQDNNAIVAAIAAAVHDKVLNS